MVISEKRKPGRPRKYKTEEEAKQAKKEYDIEYIKSRYKNDDDFKREAKKRSKIYYGKKKEKLEKSSQ